MCVVGYAHLCRMYAGALGDRLEEDKGSLGIGVVGYCELHSRGWDQSPCLPQEQ